MQKQKKPIKTKPKPLAKPNPPAKKRNTPETDGAYFLKIVILIIVGSLWIKFAHPLKLGVVQLNGFPLGLFIGLLLVSRDRYQIDRKIGYALLVLTVILTYFLPAGIFL